MSLVRCPSCSFRVALKLLPLHMKHCRAHRLKLKHAQAEAVLPPAEEEVLAQSAAEPAEEPAQAEAVEAKAKKGKKK